MKSVLYNKRFCKNGIFENPDDMVNKDDLVAWCNVYYKFKKCIKYTIEWLFSDRLWLWEGYY